MSTYIQPNIYVTDGHFVDTLYGIQHELNKFQPDDENKGPQNERREKIMQAGCLQFARRVEKLRVCWHESKTFYRTHQTPVTIFEAQAHPELRGLLSLMDIFDNFSSNLTNPPTDLRSKMNTVPVENGRELLSYAQANVIEIANRVMALHYHHGSELSNFSPDHFNRLVASVAMIDGVGLINSRDTSSDHHHQHRCLGSYDSGDPFFDIRNRAVCEKSGHESVMSPLELELMATLGFGHLDSSLRMSVNVAVVATLLCCVPSAGFQASMDLGRAWIVGAVSEYFKLKTSTTDSQLAHLLLTPMSLLIRGCSYTGGAGRAYRHIVDQVVLAEIKFPTDGLLPQNSKHIHGWSTVGTARGLKTRLADFGATTYGALCNGWLGGTAATASWWARQPMGAAWTLENETAMYSTLAHDLFDAVADFRYGIGLNMVVQLSVEAGKWRAAEAYESLIGMLVQANDKGSPYKTCALVTLGMIVWNVGSPRHVVLKTMRMLEGLCQCGAIGASVDDRVVSDGLHGADDGDDGLIGCQSRANGTDCLWEDGRRAARSTPFDTSMDVYDQVCRETMLLMKSGDVCRYGGFVAELGSRIVRAGILRVCSGGVVCPCLLLKEGNPELNPDYS